MRTLALVALFAALIAAAPASPPAPTWAYAHDLRVRPAGASTLAPDTPSIGVEVYRDGDTLIACTAQGGLSVAPAGPPAEPVTQWLAAHDLRVRGADEETFSDKSSAFGVEWFRDVAANRTLLISQTGSVTFAPVFTESASAAPDWNHAVILKVRTADESAFSVTSRQVLLECYRVGANGGFVYVTAAGGLASVPAGSAPTSAPEIAQPAQALYGLTVNVRANAGEPRPSKSLGVEVYRDPNTGALVYVSETGHVAAAPASKSNQSGQAAAWQRGFTVVARKGGAATFDEAVPVWVDVYTDENTGHTLYVTATGALAVRAK